MCSMIKSARAIVPALALFATLAGPAMAQAEPAKSSKQRVSGPITITAKTGEWREGVMIYTGDVLMVSKTLELRGARLELRQTGGKKSPYEIILNGSPSTMKHMGENPGDPVVNGRSSKMTYRSADQTIQLTGNAHLERGKDELNGDDVRYDVANRRVQASGGEKGQVRIVIDVPEQE
jgi:lipopolysaccharide export system protein LptA